MIDSLGMTVEHKQIKVDYFGQQIEVDEGIADLLQLIWKNGIYTALSCEDNRSHDEEGNLIDDNIDEIIWISFPSPNYLILFLNIVAKYPVDWEKEGINFWDTMYSRIVGGYGDGKFDWKYSIFPWNKGVEETIVDHGGKNNTEAIEKFTGTNKFEFDASVRFSKKEVPEIMKNLQEYYDTSSTNKTIYTINQIFVNREVVREPK